MSEKFKQPFTRIESGFSQARRIPRLGMIRLGMKVQSASDPKVTYPKEVSYFVCPPEVQAVYGEQPTELDVMFPVNDETVVFPQKLAWFGQGKGLKCHGNKQTALRYNEKTQAWEERACPCEQYKSGENPKGDCMEMASLMVMLPKVSIGAVYQITTRSYHSVVDINSGIDMVKDLLRGRIAMVPLKLRRVPRTTHHDAKSQTHYTMTLTLDANINGINSLLDDSRRVLDTARTIQIEGPQEENPEDGAADVIEDAVIVPSEPELKGPPEQLGSPDTLPDWGEQANQPIADADLDTLKTYLTQVESWRKDKALAVKYDALHKRLLCEVQERMRQEKPLSKAPRKAPVKAEPPKAPPREAAKAQATAQASTQAPPPNMVAFNDYIAGFEGIAPLDTTRALALMDGACKDIRLYDADYAKLEDYFYARYPSVKRPGK